MSKPPCMHHGHAQASGCGNVTLSARLSLAQPLTSVPQSAVLALSAAHTDALQRGASTDTDAQKTQCACALQQCVCPRLRLVPDKKRLIVPRA